MPLDPFYLFSFLLHFLVGIYGMYICSKKGFGFSKTASLLTATLYSLTPVYFAVLEAGHVGIIYSFAWIPLTVYFAIKGKYLLTAVFLSLIYFCHLPTFLIATLGISIIYLSNKKYKSLFFCGVITFALTAVSLIPQLYWQKESTRYLLLEAKDTYPKWHSIFEVVKSTVIPNMETEKAIALGVIPATLTFLGILKLKKKQILKIVLGVFILGLIIGNNASSIFGILQNQKWFLLLRVVTRPWMIVVFFSFYLISLSLDRYKSKIVYLIAVLGILESLFWGIKYLQKPVSINPNLAPREVYEFLSSDKSLFRVYCTNFCLSQKESAIYGLELLGGYSTLQQKNFYKQAWQLTGDYWNYYTLWIPPLGANTKNPDIKSLGEYTVKYIVSPDKIENKNLILKKEIEDYLIYENTLSTSRNYQIYTPNHIRVNVFPDDYKKMQIVIPEVYSKGWSAYLNGSKKTMVQETPNALRAVDIETDTQFVDFYYLK